MSQFEEHMDNAISELGQAISSITYPIYPEKNVVEIELLNETVELIERLKTMTIK